MEQRHDPGRSSCGLDPCKVDGQDVKCRIVVVYDQTDSHGHIYLVQSKNSRTLMDGDVIVGGNGKTPVGKFHASRWETDHVSTRYGWEASTPWSKSPLGLNAFGPYQLHIKELESRGIWIHGTMGPGWAGSAKMNRLVSPTSHGCVRCANPTIIRLHELMPKPNGNEILISVDPADVPKEQKEKP